MGNYNNLGSIDKEKIENALKDKYASYGDTTSDISDAMDDTYIDIVKLALSECEPNINGNNVMGNLIEIVEKITGLEYKKIKDSLNKNMPLKRVFDAIDKISSAIGFTKNGAEFLKYKNECISIRQDMIEAKNRGDDKTYNDLADKLDSVIGNGSKSAFAAAEDLAEFLPLVGDTFGLIARAASALLGTGLDIIENYKNRIEENMAGLEEIYKENGYLTKDDIDILEELKNIPLET